MPLPLGHTAIGLATYEISANRSSVINWQRVALITILANLPDIDVVVGLLLRADGNAFHRGPTHSLLFAVISAVLVWSANKRWLHIPGFSYVYCCLLILSHVLADAWLTRTPVSFFWPFEVNWSTGYASFGDVVHSVVFKGLQDSWIVLACVLMMLLRREFCKFRSAQKSLPEFTKPVLGWLQMRRKK